MCLTTLAVAHVKKILEQKTGDISHTFGNKNITFKYIKPDGKFIGKLIKDIQVTNYSIFAVIKEEEFILASSNYKVNKDDVLVIAEYF